MTWPGRVHDVVDALPDIDSINLRELLPRLSRLSVHGLATMYEPRSRSFPHTLRGGVGDCPPVARGMSVRYTAVAALGLSRIDPSTARDVLGGGDVAALLPGVLGLALAGRDAGALALSVWAALEMGDAQGEEVLAPADRERLSRAVERVLHHTRAQEPAPTVEHAWTLMALLAARGSSVVAELPDGTERLTRDTSRSDVRPASDQEMADRSRIAARWIYPARSVGLLLVAIRAGADYRCDRRGDRRRPRNRPGPDRLRRLDCGTWGGRSVAGGATET